MVINHLLTGMILQVGRVTRKNLVICFFQGKIPRNNWAMKKNLGWLFDIGDENLPSYMGITINHYKD